MPTKIQPAADFADELQWNNAIRLHPEIGISIALRHRLPRDLQDVPEARVDDQAERLDLALQQRVSGNLGDVRSAGHDIDRNDIGKCSAGIDANTKPRRSRVTGHASHRFPES